MHIVSVEADV
jgi:hypothetical protein